MQPINLYINPDLIKQARELNNPNLRVPDHAARGRGDTMRWVERLQISRLEIEKIEDSDRLAFKVGFKVSAESPDSINRGRPTRGYYLYNPKANGEDKDAFMSKITIGRLDSLLRAVGVEFPPGEPVNYGLIFSDPESPILGHELNATITDKPDRNDPTIRRQEVGGFTALD